MILWYGEKESRFKIRNPPNPIVESPGLVEVKPIGYLWNADNKTWKNVYAESPKREPIGFKVR